MGARCLRSRARAREHAKFFSRHCPNIIEYGDLAVARAIRTLVKVGFGGEDFRKITRLSGFVRAQSGDCLTSVVLKLSRRDADSG